MRRAILLASEAREDFKAKDRAAVRDVMEAHLRYEPTKTSRSRIKRLRGMRRPQYRLRVDEVRVFYDVTDQAVEVLAIVAKSAAAKWLERHGKPREEMAEERGEAKP